MSEELKEMEENEHHHEHEHHHNEECHHEHHHHEHDDDCDCGCHDHNHEHHHHHHDHDDDCDCGCHDHDHDHEHHHHDHGHQYNVAGYKVLETHSHEGATVCSLEMDLNKCPDSLKADMENAINELEKWLDEQGALIGHLKGYIKEAGPTTTFSTTGNGLTIENYEQGGTSVGFASIVFGPTEEELKDT